MVRQRSLCILLLFFTSVGIVAGLSGCGSKPPEPGSVLPPSEDPTLNPETDVTMPHPKKK